MRRCDQIRGREANWRFSARQPELLSVRLGEGQRAPRGGKTTTVKREALEGAQTAAAWRPTGWHLAILVLMLWANQYDGAHASTQLSELLDLGLPVNDPTVLQHCQYGDMPGTWALPPNVTIITEEELKPWPYPFGHPQLRFSPEEDLLLSGSRYQTLDPACQLKNLIQPYLDGSFAKEMPETGKPGRQPIRIMVLSDSTDTHVLQYLIESHYRRLKGDNSSAEYIRIFKDSHIKLHDRGPYLNHVITRLGLDLFQMFIVGIHAQQEADMLTRVNNARVKFEELVGLDAYGVQIQPDIISVHNVHWTLLNMANNDKNTPGNDLDMAGSLMLPQHFLNTFMNRLAHLCHLVRTAFPHGMLTMHTAAMVRHNADTGKTDGRRAWIDRMFVAQLNEAHRLVARRLMMPMVDWEHMTRGLVPRRYLNDDIHPTDWIAFEFYNVMLNLHADSLKNI